MLIYPHRDNLHKIVVLNSKGGCGKSTLATTLASYYALHGASPTLMDCDQQGSSIRWLDLRPKDRPEIHGIAAYKKSMQITRSWQLRVSQETTHLIVDSAASLGDDELRQLTRDANSILIPVLPSAIDIHVAACCIANLLLVTKIRRRDCQLAVIANRTRENTKSYQTLMRFVSSLSIPLIAVLRDTQNYVHAAGQGLGIHEMPRYKVKKDVEQMSLVLDWLGTWPERRREAARWRAERSQKVHLRKALLADG